MAAIMGHLVDSVGRSVTAMPGVAGAVCGVAGAYVLWGVGVALIVAAAFLLAVDRRMP
jgi:cytochrome c-type biogenesis protein CcmH/NrfF